jgi:uncharacterized protein with von Willebrand factor type A (vWA) domain
VDEALGRILDFIRILRNFGMRSTPSEALDAVRGTLALRPRDPEEFREILRVTLIKDPGDYGKFDELFNWYWLGGEEPRVMVERRFMVKVIVESRDSLDPVGRFMSIYSPVEVRGRVVRGKLRSGGDLRTVRRMIKALARATASTPGVRRTRGGDEVDFPRTFSNAVATLGEVARISRSTRKRTRARLIILLDISGSMEERWGLVMRMIQGLRQLPQGSYEVFMFSTSMVRITDVVGTLPIGRLEDELARIVDIWGSGTRIGECLRALVEEHGGVMGRESTLVVVSDGWDLGDLGILEDSLREIKRRVRRLVWLDPNASMHGYSPETACMRIVTRYADAVLPTEVLMNPTYMRRIAGLINTPSRK